MAQTTIGTSDAQNVLNWSTVTMYEAMDQLHFKEFLGEGEDNIIQIFDELEKNSGDTIKYDLLMKLTADGRKGNARLKGNEEALVWHQDSLVIEQLRHGVSWDRMSSQRTLHDMNRSASKNLGTWWAEKFNEYMFRYLCGDTSINHGQQGVVSDTAHYYVCGDVSHTGTIATDEGNLSNNDQIILDDLLYAREKAETNDPLMRPLRINGKDYFVVVLHPYSLNDIILNVGGSTSAIWMDIHKYAFNRGLTNPIFTNAEGVFRGMILYQSRDIYTPASNVRRNLLLGKQAGAFGIGNAYGTGPKRPYKKKDYLTWIYETDDYDNITGLGAGAIFGMKKNRFNSKDFGTMVMTAYSAAH